MLFFTPFSFQIVQNKEFHKMFLLKKLNVAQALIILLNGKKTDRYTEK